MRRTFSVLDNAYCCRYDVSCCTYTRLCSLPCVNMLFLPLQSCTVEHMAKAKVLSERTECIPIKKITPVIDEEPL